MIAMSPEELSAAGIERLVTRKVEERTPPEFKHDLPASVPRALQDLFDRLWQAWGYSHSYSHQTQNNVVYYRRERL
jgi:hypothetical protein